MADIVLKTENLRKEFGDFVAVEGLSLEIQAGEIFGFLGPNGAGKSTSIGMICGLLQPTSGNIFLHGKKVSRKDSSLRVKIGICPQQIVVWSRLTCLEQLIHMAEMYQVDARLARSRAEILLSTLGLLNQKNKQVGTLSGGMQRRMNIILSLMHDPEIIILDEPEAGLDPQSRILVREYIHSLAKIKTVILTTHNMDEAERLCTRVAIIDQGKLLELDTVENLKRKNKDRTILEIEFETEVLAKNAVEFLTNRFNLKIKTIQNFCMISDPQILEKLSFIVKELKEKSIKVSKFNIREISLEDIFIQLTERRLRE